VQAAPAGRPAWIAHPSNIPREFALRNLLKRLRVLAICLWPIDLRKKTGHASSSEACPALRIMFSRQPIDGPRTICRCLRRRDR
jgi:hypothetical protein